MVKNTNQQKLTGLETHLESKIKICISIIIIQLWWKNIYIRKLRTTKYWANPEYQNQAAYLTI